MPTKITEADGVHKEWYVEAEKMTLALLPDFLSKLTNDYTHDYGTICHAIAAAAIGAAWSVERSPQGGITGFQAGCIMWEFISHWMTEYQGKPVRLVNFEDMLYPQYEKKFDKVITPDAFNYLVAEAKSRLKDRGEAHEKVISHWRSIADGNVPFGYRVSA